MSVNPEEQQQPAAENAEVEVEEILDEVAGGNVVGQTENWPTVGNYNLI